VKQKSSKQTKADLHRGHLEGDVLQLPPIGISGYIIIHTTKSQILHCPKVPSSCLSRRWSLVQDDDASSVKSEDCIIKCEITSHSLHFWDTRKLKRLNKQITNASEHPTYLHRKLGMKIITDLSVIVLMSAIPASEQQYLLFFIF